ncbi:MAG: hypothetical protein JWM21_883 [Acidobacteria bacterium]|nr:hypothetical protein [Acidobacteriota bacterium]
MVKPLFEPTSHLVAHLLREVESAVRKGVLEPFRSEGDEEKQGSDKRKNQIRAKIASTEYFK